MNSRKLVPLCALLLAAPLLAAPPGKKPDPPGPGAPRVLSSDNLQKRPPYYLALYSDEGAVRIVSPGRITGNNGANWKSFSPEKDPDEALPAGYRRNSKITMYDPVQKVMLMALNALDTPGLDPKEQEPGLALTQYYIRYRISKDGGRTWMLDEPVTQKGNGFSAEHPIDDVQRGRNALYLGDCGGSPIRTQSGHILLPAQMTVAGPDGKLLNPFKQPSYTQVVVLIGTWRADSKIDWEVSNRIKLAANHSTRGVIEPTIAQFPDGRLLLVMRGSNAGKASLPGYKWYSVSNDDGRTWSEPRGWRYDDNKPFFSPSSMSTLVRHSSGRVFWVGNIVPKNPQGNNPRYPAVLGEVDPGSLLLRRKTVVELDNKSAKDDARGQALLGKFDGRVDLSHFWAFEDRSNQQLLVSFSRNFSGKASDWTLSRIDVSPK